jgi:peptide-methionine (S)-S-oxide reductase
VLFNRHKLDIPTPDQALKGRAEQRFAIAEWHRVLVVRVVSS